MNIQDQPKAPWRWRAGLVVFVVATLVASVVIPTTATGHIITLVEEMNEWIEPTRLAGIRLEAGLSAEHAELEAYAASHDSAASYRYQATTQANDRTLVMLQKYSAQLGRDTRASAAEIARNFGRWRIARSDGAADSVTLAINRMQLRLARENGVRLAEIRKAQRINFVSNVELVIAALAAIAAVVLLTLRERWRNDLFLIRASREASLREAAEALAATYSEEKISDVAAKTALSVAAAENAFAVDVRHQPGWLDEPRVRDAVKSNQPCILSNYDFSSLPEITAEMTSSTTSAMVIPLGNSVEIVAILFVLARKEAAFKPGDMQWARTFQHIAGLAYEKSRLLNVESEARIKLESVVESRSRLMRGFSHDVKNPLGAADGFAALLDGGVYGSLSTSQREVVERIRRSIHNSLMLIDDLHDFVKAESGHLTLRPSPTDIGKLVQTISLQYEAAAAVKNLDFTLSLPDEDTVVDTDIARLQQVVGNLLSNAIKYTDSGSIELRVTSACSADERQGVMIEVADTGCGVPLEQQKYIFEEFSRLHSGSHPGAGLGLSISKLLTDALGGELSVQSTVGVGSTFSVWIPSQWSGAVPTNPVFAVSGSRAVPERVS
jgi:signal transduction histidine kinase